MTRVRFLTRSNLFNDLRHGLHTILTSGLLLILTNGRDCVRAARRFFAPAATRRMVRLTSLDARRNLIVGGPPKVASLNAGNWLFRMTDLPKLAEIHEEGPRDGFHLAGTERQRRQRAADRGAGADLGCATSGCPAT